MSTRSHCPQEVSIPFKRPQILVTNLQNNDLCAGQLLQMICLLGTFEDFFLQTGKVRRCQLGGDDQRQQHKQKK